MTVSGAILELSAVTAVTQPGPGLLRLDLSAPGIASAICPGQFVMVKVPGGADLTLRRPFGLHAILAEGGVPTGIRLLIRMKGEGTRRLAGLRPGDSLSLLGPCGTGFTPPSPGERPVLVAAGIGAAPLGALLADCGDDAIVLYGARTSAELVWSPDRGAVSHCTDDGSEGLRGTLLDLVAERLPDLAGHRLRWYVCGPVPFMALLAPLVAAGGWPMEAAFDRRMACGFGVCLGCVVPMKGTTDKPSRACVEGPVFDGALVDWEKLAREPL
jgi:dihydroorotate dehydrogenase electron transfer subunit